MDTIDKIMPLFTKHYKNLGEIQIRAFNLNTDIKIIHDWVTKPYAKYWEMQNFTKTQVEEAYKNIEYSKHHHVRMGMLNDEPVFLMEYYEPAKDAISEHYEVLSGDIGMHLLVAPVEKRIPQFTWHVFTSVMDFLFSNSEIKRIVVEPDSGNKKIHVLNTKAGFQYEKEIQLPHKKARLAICTRKGYEYAIQKSTII